MEERIRKMKEDIEEDAKAKNAAALLGAQEEADKKIKEIQDQAKAQAKKAAGIVQEQLNKLL